MAYCPHCSEALPKPVKVCPFCNKTIDAELLSAMYQSGESSDIDKKARRKVWLREKLLFILPVMALVIGVIAGAVIMAVVMEIQYASSRSSYEEQIKTLQEEINNHAESAANANIELNNTLMNKDRIIASLTELNSIYSRMVAFTNRLSRNCTITPSTPQDIDYYQRNIRYLQSLFQQEQENLKTTDYDSTKTYNLVPIPQFLE